MNDGYARNIGIIDDVAPIYRFYLHLDLMSETFFITGLQKLMLVSNKLKIMWKQAAVASFNVKYRNFPGMADATRHKPQRVWWGPRPQFDWHTFVISQNRKSWSQLSRRAAFLSVKLRPSS
jgi:hypothetical protein